MMLMTLKAKIGQQKYEESMKSDITNQCDKEMGNKYCKFPSLITLIQPRDYEILVIERIQHPAQANCFLIVWHSHVDLNKLKEQRNWGFYNQYKGSNTGKLQYVEFHNYIMDGALCSGYVNRYGMRRENHTKENQLHRLNVAKDLDVLISQSLNPALEPFPEFKKDLEAIELTDRKGFMLTRIENDEQNVRSFNASGKSNLLDSKWVRDCNL